MLEIKIGDSWVDTNELEIPVVLRSPLFSEGKGSFLFNFSLPATTTLRSEFSYLHRPSRSGPSSLSKPLSLSAGPLKFAGIAVVSEASSESYEISCPVDSGDIAKLFKSKKLADIDMEGERLPLIESLRVDAKLLSDIDINLSQPEFFTHVVDLNFQNISVNPAGELDIAGSSFSTTINQPLVLIFKLESFNNTSNLALLRVYKNGVMLDPVAIQNSLTINYEIAPASGDVISWDFFLESIGDTEHTIQFTIYEASQLIVMLGVDLMAQSGLQQYPYSDYAVFPIENKKFFENIEDDTYQIDHVSFKEISGKYFPVLNYYVNNKFPVILTGNIDGESFNTFNLFTPFPYLAYVIRRIAIHLGISIENNVFENPELNQLCIFNAYAENNFITNDLIRPNKGINLANHVPDILLSNYWISICNLLGIAWSYNSSTKKLRLANLESIAKDSAYINWPGTLNSMPYLQAFAYNGFSLKQVTSGDSYITDNYKSLDGLQYKGEVNIWNQLSGIVDPQINDCYFVVFWKEYFIWNYDKELSILNWVFHSKDFFFEMKNSDTGLETDPLEIVCNVNPIMLNNRWDSRDHNLCAPKGRAWLIPVTSQAGNFDGLPDFFKADFSNSLLFFRGLNYDSQGNLYPLGSPDVYNYNGEQIIHEGLQAHLNLRWEGEFGLYTKRYKKWIDFRLKSPGTWEFRAFLTNKQIAEIDYFKWYSINNHQFLIIELQFSIFQDHLSEVIVKAIAR